MRIHPTLRAMPWLLALLSAVAQGQTLGLQDLPDEDRASVKKELARQRKDRRATATEAGTDAAAAADGWRTGLQPRGCTLSVGANDPAAPSSRHSKQVIVATKPVVQVCGR